MVILAQSAATSRAYAASAVLVKVVEHVHQHQVRLVLSCVLGPVRQQLDRYGISEAVGQGAYFDTPGEALEAFHSSVIRSGERSLAASPPGRCQLPARWRMLRRATAMMVFVGLCAPEVTNTDPSATYTLSRPCTWP